MRARDRSGILLLSLTLFVFAASGAAAERGRSSAALPREVSAERADFGLKLRTTRLPSGEVALLIGEAIEGGPAYRAGIRGGDLIVGVDGPLPEYANDVERILDFDHRFRAGDRVAVEVETAGSRRVVEIEVGAMSAERQSRLLGWLAAAERKLAKGLSLDCGELAVDSESSWVRLAVQAMSYPAAKLYVTRGEGGGLSLATEPLAFTVPADFSVDDVDPAIRLEIERLGAFETLEITFSMSQGPPPILDVSYEKLARPKRPGVGSSRP